MLRGQHILIVDDDPLTRLSLQEHFEHAGCVVCAVATGRAALDQFGDAVACVLLDHALPDMDGLDLLQQLRERARETPVILLTAQAKLDVAVEAIKRGAYHFAAKPCDLEWLALTVARALERTRLHRRVSALRGPLDGMVDDIVGESSAMQRVKKLIARVARSPASTVLLTGETGTGKDLAARALHSCSQRRKGPFLNVTCSALPETLLESELFGHERGAFTDAKVRKRGLFELADGGTVFLDEIGEMALPLQGKVLRFLEERAFRRVGGTSEIRPNVRVIAATNIDLETAVQARVFRQDLYFRLAVIPIRLPPLRERENDVLLLAEAFVKRFNVEFNRSVCGLTNGAARSLVSYGWPGNVRELRNVVERAMLLDPGSQLTAQSFEELAVQCSCGLAAGRFSLPADGIDLHALERTLLEQALARSRGNQCHAAALLHMTRDQIRYRMEKYGLLPKQRRAADQATDRTAEPAAERRANRTWNG